MKIRSFIAKALVVIFVLGLGAGGFYGYSFYKMIQNMEKNRDLVGPVELPEIKDKKAPINVLIMGVDTGDYTQLDWTKRSGRGRTDTMMLVSYHPVEKKLYILSIPRDSRVKIKGGYEKINAAYAYGGTNLAVKTVEEALDLPIHHYVTLNNTGFIKIVEAVGGVTIDYIDPKINKEFNIGRNKLPTGKNVKLNGQQAFAYVHVRNSDIERTERQRKFFKAFYAEVRSANILWKLPRIMESLGENMQTDMAPTAVLSLANRVRTVPAESVVTEILPGKAQNINGGSYWVIDEQKAEEVLAKIRSGEKSVATDTGQQKENSIE